jgi:hypothetical protein
MHTMAPLHEDDDALALLATQRALLKTVKNGDWLGMLWQLSQHGQRFRTSCSLPPPNGRGMALFGRTASGVAGLVWDIDEVLALSAEDETGIFVWPPGYNAKTEFNMLINPKTGRVGLLGGRDAHLTTIDALRLVNLEHVAEAAARSAAGREPMPPLGHNEISLRLEGVRGMRGVFVRSAKPAAFLFALGVRSMIEHALPSLKRRLTLLCITSFDGASVVSDDDQLSLLKAEAGRTIAASSSTVPCSDGNEGRWQKDGLTRLPIDTTRYLDRLTPIEALAVHVSWGITHDSLLDAISRIPLRIAEGTSAFKGMEADRDAAISWALRAMARAGNSASMRELIRATAPLLLRRAYTVGTAAPHLTVPQTSLAQQTAAAAAAAAAPPSLLSSVASNIRPDHSLLGNVAFATREPGDSGATGARDQESGENGGEDGGEDSGKVKVRLLIRAVGSGSEDMLVALGAQIALREFVEGRTSRRLQSAVSLLVRWLEEAQRPSCTSLLFRLRSWSETRALEPESDLNSFVCGKAITNRAKFCRQLRRLAEANDGLSYVSVLYDLVSQLHRPCLRLHILQDVLGLDDRFSRDITYGVTCLAYDIVERMQHGGAMAVGSHGLDLDGYDEAVRLDADTAFHEVRRRPSDPVGEAHRRYRVLCCDR